MSTSEVELFDGVFELEDLTLERCLFEESDANGHDGPLDAAGSPEVGFAGHKAVGHILLFADWRQRHDDFNRLAVGCEDDCFDASFVEPLHDFVDPLLDLLVDQQLLYQLADLLLQLGLHQGLCLELDLGSWFLLGSLIEDVDESFFLLLLLLLTHLITLDYNPISNLRMFK